MIYVGIALSVMAGMLARDLVSQLLREWWWTRQLRKNCPEVEVPTPMHED